MGITITDIKVIGNCSKHGNVMKNKFNEPISDKDICCLDCTLSNRKESVKSDD